MYADKLHYATKYLQGRERVIPADEFLFWAAKAQRFMNWRGIEMLEIPPYLADCCCEVAEELYKQEQWRQAALQPAQKVGSYSVGTVPRLEQEDEQTRLQTIMASWLAGTPLYNWFVYRGL